MVVLIGFIIVCGSVVGGLHLGGGSVMVLMHLSEFVAVVGICAGVLVIASPMSVLKDVAAKTITAFKGGPIPKGAHMEGMKMMFHLFILARKEGLMILEEHLVDPKNSEILKKYPNYVSQQKSSESQPQTSSVSGNQKFKPVNSLGDSNKENIVPEPAVKRGTLDENRNKKLMEK